MEEIRETAQIHYKAMPKEVRNSAKKFFKTMDDNGDGKVNLAEFAAFIGEEGYKSLNNPAFFEEINRDKSNELDHDDVKTLFYIIQSGRPLCGRCKKLIVGMYFTCQKCFACESKSFCLHPACFRSGKYAHNHKHSHFLDNYALLESMRLKALSGGGGGAQKNQQSSETSTSEPESDGLKKKRDAFKDLQMALAAVGTATSLAATISSCTMM